MTAAQLAVVYNRDNAASVRVAKYYAASRHIPPANLVGLSVPDRAVLTPEEARAIREVLALQMPSAVQSLLLVWSRPYAVGCMSITTAIAAGYRSDFCEPGCALTRPSPLFDSDGWIPADTAGWFPAMLMPSDDEPLAHAVIDRGIRADRTSPTGIAYLIRTQDGSRNVRAGGYGAIVAGIGTRFRVKDTTTPVVGAVGGILAYFTGVPRVVELPQLTFIPGAVADHLTSTGGVLDGVAQMSALEWLKQGATASYGTVSEPCAHPEKFPNPSVFLNHYLRGDTLLEAYWKSVQMPGQGLFIGEPLATPFSGS